jgi:hypothetical protein
MLDDLRGDADFFDEEEPEAESQGAAAAAPAQSQFLGMTPVQRFVIAFLFLMMVCILGTFFLLITDTIWLPF